MRFFVLSCLVVGLTACGSTPNIEHFGTFSTTTATVSRTLSAQGGAINRDTRRFFIREALKNPGMSIQDSQECSQKADVEKIASINNLIAASLDLSSPPVAMNDDFIFCLQTPTLNSQSIGAISQVFSTLSSYATVMSTLSSDELRTGTNTAINTLETELQAANTALQAANIQGENNDTISEVTSIISLLSRALTEDQRRDAVQKTMSEAIPLYRTIIDRHDQLFVQYARVREWLPRIAFIEATQYIELRERIASLNAQDRRNTCNTEFSKKFGQANCITNYGVFSESDRRQILAELDALAPLQGIQFDRSTRTLFTRMKSVLEELEAVKDEDLGDDTESLRAAIRAFSSSATAYTRVSNALEFPGLGD